jgi:hypothetical protein
MPTWDYEKRIRGASASIGHSLFQAGGIAENGTYQKYIMHQPRISTDVTLVQ